MPHPMRTERNTGDRRRMRLVAIGVALVLLSIGVCIWRWKLLNGESGEASASSAVNGGVSAQAAYQLVPSSLSVIGTIEADEISTVVAPFDAVVRERVVDFDAQAAKGQTLLVLDSSDLTDRINEAKVAMLRAQKAMQDLEAWEGGGEVTRARRNLTQAQQQADQTTRKVSEAEALLKKGIIPRSELDGLMEQLSGFKAQQASASDDLKAVMEKASKSNREIANLEYKLAKAKVDRLTESLPLANIVAPVAGIVSKALTSSGQPSATLDAGGRVTKGQVLLNIASMSALRVTARVDEMDVVGLAPGMPVEVSLESQDLPAIKGVLRHISAQAVQSGNGVRSALFDISVSLPGLDDHQRSRLRIGMSCNVSIGLASTPVSKSLPGRGPGTANVVVNRGP